VLRASDTHRAEFSFVGPIDHPPQQICDLVGELVSDLALVDKTNPVAVAPVAFEPDKDSARFRIQYWTRGYFDRCLVEGEIVRRIWYAFQRNRIAFPHPTACALSASAQESLSRKLESAEALAPDIGRILPQYSAGAAEGIAKESRLLLFAPDERLIMPEWSDGWRYLLLRGEAFEVPEFDLTPELAGAESRLAVERLGPTAAITRLADELSLIIGPYAKLAVMRAGDRTQSYEELAREVAKEIDHPSSRERFLEKVLRAGGRTWRPGVTIPARRNASGQLASEPSLRAVGEVALLAMPAGLLEQFAPRAAAE
jgi:hypothetical protein